MTVLRWLLHSVHQDASDLHLCSGEAPRARIDGRLQPLLATPEAVEPDLLRAWCEQTLDSPQRQRLAENGQVDLALTLASGERFRVNIFRQYCGLSLALRRIADQAPRLETLQTPPLVTHWLTQTAGLVLITGATGSGKSTTLAAMIDRLNQTRDCHILTLEDPIEFLHQSQRALIQQREIGQHCASFQQGLHGALREDPDIILLGELRDTATIRLALTAAETGHLVLATLHTRGAAQAPVRLIDTFPAEEKSAIRSQLAGSLLGVMAQKLISQTDGGRVALFETLAVTPAVSHLIREGKDHQLPGVMQTGSQAGMQTFAQSYQQRVAQGLIVTESAENVARESMEE